MAASLIRKSPGAPLIKRPPSPVPPAEADSATIMGHPPQLEEEPKAHQTQPSVSAIVAKQKFSPCISHVRNHHRLGLTSTTQKIETP